MMLEILAQSGSRIATLAEAHLVVFALVFLRVGAIAALLPGFGEAFLPARLRLGLGFALAVLVYPAVGPAAPPLPRSIPDLALIGAAETGIGLLIGLSLRLMVMALQFAGSIAAQTTALAQIAGPGIAPDPMPAIGNTLLLAGLTLAMVLGLHEKVVLSLIASYQGLGFGFALPGADLAAWGVAAGSAAFALALQLAGPFVLAAFLYNLALGAINRAMPQLMVAFVGAPAITAGTLLLLLLAAPVILTVWHDRLDAVLARPPGAAR